MSERSRSEGEPAHVADAYDVLCHPVRRRILFELTQQAGPTRLDSLAEAISRTAVADGDGLQHLTTDSAAVATSLRHRHLPKLVDAGWIEYDEDGIIQYRSHAEQIQTDLRDVMDELTLLRAALAETHGSGHSRA